MRSHFVEKLNRVQILFPLGKIAIADKCDYLCATSPTTSRVRLNQESRMNGDQSIVMNGSIL